MLCFFTTRTVFFIKYLLLIEFLKKIKKIQLCLFKLVVFSITILNLVTREKVKFFNVGSTLVQATQYKHYYIIFKLE